MSGSWYRGICWAEHEGTALWTGPVRDSAAQAQSDVDQHNLENPGHNATVEENKESPWN
jgi:hypothetical protein